MITKRKNCFVVSIIGCLLCTLSLHALTAQETSIKDLVSPVYGKIFLAGTAELSPAAVATFAHMAGGENGKLLLIYEKKKIDIPDAWKEKTENIKSLILNGSSKELDEEQVAMIREATAIWLSGDLSKNFAGSQLNTELEAALKNDCLIGGQGLAAESMGTEVKGKKGMRPGFNLIPNSYIETSGDKGLFNKTIEELPGRLGWDIPPTSAAVIHNSRRIAVISYPGILLATAAHGDWPARSEFFSPPYDELPYTADLISWNRSATNRLDPVFPPENPPVPELSNGALLIIGGHGFPKGMWKKVVDYAGGKDARYVCFSQTEHCSGAEHLRELGCKNIAIYVTKTGVDGINQGSDPELLEDLKDADAVYFGGGRTYKFMDAYLGTPAEELMHDVLKRGGIILGSSAGAQIQGDFLVRGDPRTNETLWMEGSNEGLGFLQGVIIDAHYRERGRQNISPQKLFAKFPQMLGIGIDETTAIFVEKSIAEVWGPHSVNFYDFSEADPSAPETVKETVLMEGEKYDLKNRKKID